MLALGDVYANEGFPRDVFGHQLQRTDVGSRPTRAADCVGMRVVRDKRGGDDRGCGR